MTSNCMYFPLHFELSGFSTGNLCDILQNKPKDNRVNKQLLGQLCVMLTEICGTCLKLLYLIVV